MREIITLEQQRLARGPRKGVGKATPEIQPRWMPAASTEIPVGFARDPCLGFGNWLDDKLGFFDEIVKAAAGDRIAASVNNDCRFDEIDR